MLRFAPLVLLPLLGLTGCLALETERRPLPLVNSAPAVARLMPPERLVSTVPAMKESSERVVMVGQRLILANPQIGLRPLFITVGVQNPEIFHKGGSLGSSQVVISEGLVRLCPSDAELAAVLAMELGKIVTERVALASPAARLGNDRPPPMEAIGPDSGGTFGSSDGTHMMEMARYEARRRDRATKSGPPDPRALAQNYLAKAKYEPASLEKVQPLLRKAEDHFEMEKSIGMAVLPPPPPSSSPAPAVISSPVK